MSVPILFLFLLASAAAVAILPRYRPRLVPAAAVLLSGLALLIWLFTRALPPIPSLPIPSPLIPPPLTPAAWLLLLLFALALGQMQKAGSGPPFLAFAFLLLAFALPALWADSVYSLAQGVAWLIVPWLAAVWRGALPDARRCLACAAAWLTAVLLLLYAAAFAPLSGGWELAGWPPAAMTALLLAAVSLIGVWPFFNWRLRLDRLPLPLTVVLVLTPTAIGSLLLSRIAAAGQINPAWQILLTALALLSYLRGLHLAWTRLHLPASASAAILFAQAQLVILAGLWAGPAAVLSLVQTLILAGGILALAAGQTIDRRHWHRAIPPALALAALAGLPFTAGFVGLSALYDAWLANGRFLLLLVMGLFVAPLVAAVYLLLLRPKTTPQTAEMPEKRLTARDGAAILLAVSLLAAPGVAWSAIHPLTWLVILLPPLAGLALARCLPQAREAQALVRQAFTFGPALRRTQRQTQDAGRAIGAAFNDALTLLETDGGLVWVFILALLFYLVIGNQ